MQDQMEKIMNNEMDTSLQCRWFGGADSRIFVLGSRV